MRLNKSQKILAVYLLFLVIYWFILRVSGSIDGNYNYLYSFAFSLIPLLGGIYGIFFSRIWGFFRSAIGRAILFTSLGLFSWGAGSMIWSYYNFFEKVAAPYPSLADVGFLASLPLWLVGIVNLSKATGAKFGFQKVNGKILLLTLPIIVLILSYYLLVEIARDGILTTDDGGYLKIFFDLAYPMGDVLILTFAVVIFGLSLKYFGGVYKLSILSIIMGFCVMYFADFIFSYTTTVGTFYVGNFGDLIFTVALFLITIGVLGFSESSKNIVH